MMRMWMWRIPDRMEQFDDLGCRYEEVSMRILPHVTDTSRYGQVPMRCLDAGVDGEEE